MNWHLILYIWYLENIIFKEEEGKEEEVMRLPATDPTHVYIYIKSNYKEYGDDDENWWK